MNYGQYCRALAARAADAEMLPPAILGDEIAVSGELSSYLPRKDSTLRAAEKPIRRSR
jgi:hypothetical protein